ncbi:MAG: winged helix-turn-helix domain-containing protein [Nitrososphaeraceae archaeon]
MKKRNRLQILAVILEIANGNRVKRSKIVQKTYLSHYCLRRYLPLLLERDLIQYKGDDRTYITTYKGLHFLQIYNKIDELVNQKK